MLHYDIATWFDLNTLQGWYTPISIIYIVTLADSVACTCYATLKVSDNFITYSFHIEWVICLLNMKLSNSKRNQPNSAELEWRTYSWLSDHIWLNDFPYGFSEIQFNNLMISLPIISSLVFMVALVSCPKNARLKDRKCQNFGVQLMLKLLEDQLGRFLPFPFLQTMLLFW